MPEKPMIYISFGVPKSASTFTYIVTETVLRVAGCSPVALSETAKGGKSRLNYISEISWSAIERVRSEIGDQSAVIKTHGAPDKTLLNAIEQGEIFASAVIRDPREIALSLLDHARRSRSLGILDFAKLETVTDTVGVLDDAINRLAKWMESRKVLLHTYEEISFDTESAVRRIVEQIGLPVTPAAVIAALEDRSKIRQFNKGVRNRYKTEMPLETQRLFLDRYADTYRRYLAQELGGQAVKSDQCAIVSSMPHPSLSAAPGAAANDTLRIAGVASQQDVVSQLVRALYRVLLFREPDATGLNSYVRAIQAGRPIEDIVRKILRSREFAGKRTQFTKTYISSAHLEKSQQD